MQDPKRLFTFDALRRRPLPGLAAAGICVLAAFALRSLAAPPSAGIAYLTFFPAVIIACALAGGRAAAGATVVSALLADWFFVPPLGSLSIHPQHLQGMLEFVAGCALGCVPTVLLRQAVASRQQALNRAAAGERRFRALFDAMGEGFVAGRPLRDAAGRVVDLQLTEVNPAFPRLTGIDTLTALGRPLTDILPGMQRCCLELVERALACGGPQQTEGYVDGLRRWFVVQAFPLEDGQFALLFRDISDRKRAEERLRDSQTRYELATRATAGVVYDWDLTTGKVLRSTGLVDLIGLEPAQIGDDATDWRRRIHPDDIARLDAEWDRAVADGSGTIQSEYRCRHADGHWIDVWDRALILRDPDGQPMRLVGTSVDVTDRRQTERTLRQALDQRDAMIREVHHRVKNSLQAVSSLLNVQAGRLGPQGMRKAFDDAIARIQAVATVHQALYRDDDLARVRLDEHLHELCAQIGALHDGGRTRVRCQVEAGEAEVAPDDLVPLALIVNELVTNAFKHAYAPGTAGIVSVRLGMEGGRLRLEVADSGQGLPEGIDPLAGRSLGMKLVKLLVGQLNGTLQVERLAPGTRFVCHLRGERTARDSAETTGP